MSASEGSKRGRIRGAGTRRVAVASPPIKLGCSWESWPTTSFTCSGNSTSWARKSNDQWNGSSSVSSRSEQKSRITVGGGRFMWLLRFLWPITIAQCLGEGPRSRLRLTGEAREWYAQIPENVPLIWHEGGNWGRWTIHGSAGKPIRGSRPFGQPGLSPKRKALAGSRTNSR